MIQQLAIAVIATILVLSFALAYVSNYRNKIALASASKEIMKAFEDKTLPKLLTKPAPVIIEASELVEDYAVNQQRILKDTASENSESEGEIAKIADSFEIRRVSGGRVILAAYEDRTVVRVAKSGVRETLGEARSPAELEQLLLKAEAFEVAVGSSKVARTEGDYIAVLHQFNPLPSGGHAIVSQYPDDRVRVRVARDDTRAEIGWATTDIELEALLLKAEMFTPDRMEILYAL